MHPKGSGCVWSSLFCSHADNRALIRPTPFTRRVVCGHDGPLWAAPQFRFGSLFPVDRLLAAYGTHQSELHQHDLVTEPWKPPVANPLQTAMQCARVALHAPCEFLAFDGNCARAADQAFVPGLLRASVSAFPLARRRPGANALTDGPLATASARSPTRFGGSAYFVAAAVAAAARSCRERSMMYAWMSATSCSLTRSPIRGMPAEWITPS